MKKVLFSLIVLLSLLFNLSSAQADPTYAVLDSNGNVTNIIVCGAACASGEFGGNKVVLQVAANPVTGENRGGFWQGPGTTTYNENTGVFTVNHQLTQINEQKNNIEETNSITDAYNVQESTTSNVINENGTQTTTIITRSWDIEEETKINTNSEINISGNSSSFSFKYEDTVGSNLFTRNGFIKNWSNESSATISVTNTETKTISKIVNDTKNVLSIETQVEQESKSFDNRKTAQEIKDSVTNDNLSLLSSKIEILISLLGSWVK